MSHSFAAASPDISPNPRNNGVVLRDHVIKPAKKNSVSRKDRQAGPPKSGCTYSGMYISCPTPRPARAGATFTPGMAESAVRDLPMPALKLRVQPEGPTLVNADTIFYAEPRPFRTSIDLLGHTIRVRATPVNFIWIHGDGTSQATATAGHPYPNGEIAHRYMRPAAGVSARVDTVYDVEFSIDGDEWESLDAPLVATGPSTSLEVQEAAPVLVR